MNNGPDKGELLYKIIYDATREKFAILPFLAGLFLALISLGVSGELFQVTSTIRYLVTALLLLMMVSIQISYSQNSALLVEAEDKFHQHYGTKSNNTALTVSTSIVYLLTGKARGQKINSQDFFDRLSSQFPAMAILLMWAIVFIMINEIWK